MLEQRYYNIRTPCELTIDGFRGCCGLEGDSNFICGDCTLGKKVVGDGGDEATTDRTTQSAYGENNQFISGLRRGKKSPWVRSTGPMLIETRLN
jgi:hypothetical protein